MRLIMGLDAPSSGSVTVNGRHYHDLGWPLREVGALLEAKAIHPGRSAYSHLRMLAQTNHIPKSRVEEMLDLVGLSAGLSWWATSLSAWANVSASRRRCSVTLACCCSTSRSTASILTGFVGYATSCDVSRPKGGLSSSPATSISEMALTADQVVVIGKGRTHRRDAH